MKNKINPNCLISVGKQASRKEENPGTFSSWKKNLS